jgi:hypothetical protein
MDEATKYPMPGREYPSRTITSEARSVSAGVTKRTDSDTAITVIGREASSHRHPISDRASPSVTLVGICKLHEYESEP